MEVENQSLAPASETVIEATPVSVTVETPPTPEAVEAAAEAETETVEAVVDSAVAIAQIEADKEVEIAGMNAGVEIARIEAQAEAVEAAREEQDEMQWLRERMNLMEQNQAEMMAMLSSLANPQSTPEALAAELADETMETLTPQSMSDEISEIETEVSPSSEDEKPGAEAEPATATVRIKRRAI